MPPPNSKLPSSDEVVRYARSNHNSLMECCVKKQRKWNLVFNDELTFVALGNRHSPISNIACLPTRGYTRGPLVGIASIGRAMLSYRAHEPEDKGYPNYVSDTSAVSFSWMRVRTLKHKHSDSLANGVLYSSSGAKRIGKRGRVRQGVEMFWAETTG